PGGRATRRPRRRAQHRRRRGLHAGAVRHAAPARGRSPRLSRRFRGGMRGVPCYPAGLCHDDVAIVITERQLAAHAAEGCTRIPLVREVPSALDTPLSVYLKLADGPHSFLFESVEGGANWGRHSIIGLPARRVYAFHG